MRNNNAPLLGNWQWWQKQNVIENNKKRKKKKCERQKWIEYFREICRRRRRRCHRSFLWSQCVTSFLSKRFIVVLIWRIFLFILNISGVFSDFFSVCINFLNRWKNLHFNEWMMWAMRRYSIDRIRNLNFSRFYIENGNDVWWTHRKKQIKNRWKCLIDGSNDSFFFFFCFICRSLFRCQINKTLTLHQKIKRKEKKKKRKTFCISN